MNKAMTSEQKYNATCRAVIELLQSSGPCEMPGIVSEVKAQAYAGYLPKAMYELRQNLTIKFDAEFNCFEMMQ